MGANGSVATRRMRLVSDDGVEDELREFSDMTLARKHKLRAAQRGLYDARSYVTSMGADDRRKSGA